MSKISKKLIIAIILPFLFSGCIFSGGSSTTSVEQKTIIAESLTFELSKSVISVGGTCSIGNVKFSPTNVTKKDIEFFAKNDDIASIKGTTVTGLKEGSTKIFGRTLDGSNLVYSVPLTVGVPISSLSLSLDKTSVDVGETINASVGISPNNASNKTYTLTAEPSNIVSITGNVITGLKNGSTRIKAIANDGSKVESNSINIYVSEISAKSISLSADSTILKVGQQTTLRYTITPENAVDKTLKFKTQSGTTNVISVTDNGVVTANNIGEEFIIAYLVSNPNINASLKISVFANEPTGIVLSISKSSLCLYETAQLTYSFTPSGSYSYNVMFKTQSGNSNIVNISENGVVTGLKEGSETIVAYLQNNPEVKGTISVKVLNKTNPDDPAGKDDFDNV